MLLSDCNNKLVDEILSGNIRPDGSIKAFASMNGECLNINFPDIESENIVFFYWNYNEKKPLYVRRVDVVNHNLLLEDTTTIINQMKFTKMYSMRLAMAMVVDGNYRCFYLRNADVSEDYSEVERYIGKIKCGNGKAFISYYTDNGNICVKFMDLKRFDSSFYRAKLVGFDFDNNILTGYVEMPAYEGVATGHFVSTDSNKCMDLGFDVKYQGTNGVKNIYKICIDLTKLNSIEGLLSAFIEVSGKRFTIISDDCEEAVFTVSCDEIEFNVAIREKNKKVLFDVEKRIYPVMISIVTAVYNTAPFLSEMINSVLNQDITELYDEYVTKQMKYSDIFELILVDDGSTDGSAEILDDYARLSDRVKVIHKKNGGVSSARNAGLDIARGKYVNFADSDDKISQNYMKQVLRFFEEHEDDVSVVAVPLKYFDGKSGDHWANYKFSNEAKVADLVKNPSSNIYTVNSACVKRESISDLRFDENLKIGEDMCFINKVITQEGKNIGLVGNAYYFYRVRTIGEESAMDNLKNNTASYIPVVKDVFMNLIEENKKKYGYVPKHVQHTVMGQLQWRFASTDKGESVIEAIGVNDFNEYKALAFGILKDIDEDVILAQKKIWSEHKYFILKKKYGKKPEFISQKDDLVAKFGEYKVGTTVGNCYLKIEFMNISDNILHLEGFSMNYELDMKLNVYLNDQRIEYKETSRDASKYTFDEVCYYAKSFVVDIPLESNVAKYNIRFTTEVNGLEVEKRQLRYSKMVPLSEMFNRSYYQVDDWTVRKEGNVLSVYNLGFEDGEVIDFEKEFISEVARTKSKAADRILKLRSIALSRKAREKSGKKIWLISDRGSAAGDNGEAFFKYVCNRNDESVEAYYIIDRNTTDFERLKQYGNVIERGSDKHLIMHLMADYYISSSGDEWVINPFHTNKVESESVKDLSTSGKFIFLQHGITVSNQSAWLNKYNKNIEGIVCSTKEEADSFVEYEYYYDKRNAWLTGFPRYDCLYNDCKNYITIMPTWRKWLTDGAYSNKPGAKFKDSEYLAFYNDLLNDERLLDAADKYGYKICYLPHPTVREAINLFKKNDRVIFFDSNKTYREIYAESNMVMTDYSSSVMDFAYLKKPVVYCQFDEEMFWNNHTYSKGFFSWEDDGFGEVTYTKDELVTILIEYMANGCKMKDKYKKRVDKFFAYQDDNNSQRIFDKIIGLN